MMDLLNSSTLPVCVRVSGLVTNKVPSIFTRKRSVCKEKPTLPVNKMQNHSKVEMGQSLDVVKRFFYLRFNPIIQFVENASKPKLSEILFFEGFTIRLLSTFAIDICYNLHQVLNKCSYINLLRNACGTRCKNCIFSLGSFSQRAPIFGIKIFLVLDLYNLCSVFPPQNAVFIPIRDLPEYNTIYFPTVYLSQGSGRFYIAFAFVLSQARWFAHCFQ